MTDLTYNQGFTWFFALKLFLFLAAFYLLLKMLLRLLPFALQNNPYKDPILNVLKGFKVLLKPLSIVAMLVAVISIDVLVHGILFLVLALFSYTYIKNYLSGIVFKINLLVKKGEQINLGETTGKIDKFLPFGFILRNNLGAQYVPYSQLDKTGFQIKYSAAKTSTQHFLIQSIASNQDILDALFHCPFVDYSKKPDCSQPNKTNQRLLKIRLESGCSQAAFFQFFEEFYPEIQLTLDH
ncbi:MAG: hypothetical protein ACPGEC_02160 [Flavobacteriales bacterium]